MSSTPEFEAWVDQARQKTVVQAYEMLGGLPLTKTSEGYEGPCPVCGGKDRFSIATKKNVFNCRQCSEGGNVIDLVKFAQGVDFIDAVKFITGEAPPDARRGYDGPMPDDTSMRERRAEERARRDDEEKARLKKQAESTASAKELFDRAKPFKASLADKYLRSRSIALTDDQAFDLRFMPLLEYKGLADNDAKEETTLGSFPAMLAAIRGQDGTFMGVHRTYLDPKGNGKLRPPGSSRNIAKKVWGVQKGGHIRLGAIVPNMVIGEGIESTAGWYGLGIGSDDLGMMVGVNLGNLAGASTEMLPHPKLGSDKRLKIPNGVPDPASPSLVFPKGIESVIFLGDGDSDFHATRAKILTGARKAEAAGIKPLVHFAPNGDDFNDVLRRNEAGKLGPILPLAEYAKEVEPLLYPQKVFKSRYGMLPWSDLDKPGPEQEWLVDSLLTARDKSIIAGPSMSGKSFFALSVGMAIARGVPVFDFDVQQGLVIYQAGEGALGVKKRLRAYRKHFQVSTDDNIPFVLLQSRVDLFAEEGDTAPLIEEITAIRGMYDAPLRIIFIDTLATAQGVADENSGKDMARVLDNIDKIRVATGVHVCLVHHLNADGTKLRGHTSVTANVDQVLAVSCDKETKVRTVRTSKMKDGDDTTTFNFELMQIILGKDVKGKEITSCVALPSGEKEALRALDGVRTFMANDNEKKFMKALFGALRDHGTPTPAHIRDRIPSSTTTVVEYEQVKELYCRLDLRDEDASEPEKARARRKAALKRALDKLQSNGILGVDNPFVWFTGRPVSGVPESWPRKPPQKRVTSGPILALGELEDDDIPF